MQKRKKNNGVKGGWRRPALITVCVILALVLIVLVAAAVGMNHFLGQIDRIQAEDNYTVSREEAQKLEQEDNEAQTPEQNGTTAPHMDENEVIWDATPEKILGENDDNLLNILLIGQDRREGEGRTRSDAMILCTVNKEKKTLTLTSFLRDLYVQIPGYQDTRINAAYAFGGMELLDETLRVNFGVGVDANVEVDFNGFESVINAMGGVAIWLTESEAAYLNNAYGWSLPAGSNWLNGEQALAYSRIRYLDSDFGRTNRQRTVLTALVESVRSASLDQLLSLVNTVLPMITTDMSNSQIISYATELFPLLADLEIETQHIPVDDGYQSATIRGMMVLVPDLEVNRQMLIDTLS